MPNWLKQTLHVIAIAAGCVIALPAAGVALPAAVVAIAGVVGLAAAKAAPGYVAAKSE